MPSSKGIIVSICRLLTVQMLLISDVTGIQQTTEVPGNSSIYGFCSGSQWSCSGRCGEFRAIPCSCEVKCKVYRTCCEDFTEVCDQTTYLDYHHERFHNAQTECLWNGLRLIVGCPKTTDWHLTFKCLLSQKGIEDLVPVTDTKYGLQFKNAACAECNGLTDILRLNMELYCPFDIPVNMEEAADFILRGKCNAVFKPPEEQPDAVICLETFPSMCMEDEYKRQCESHFSYVTVHNTVTQISSDYQNRFCVMCLNEVDLECSTPSVERIVDVNAHTKYSALMNWRGQGVSIVTSKTEPGEKQPMSVTRTCPMTFEPGSNECKVTSCPGESFPVFNSSYCLSMPIRVMVMLGLGTDTSERMVALDTSKPPPKGCTRTGPTVMSLTNRRGVIWFKCTWDKNPSFPRKKHVQRIYRALVDQIEDKHTIVDVTLTYYSIMDKPILPSSVTYTVAQLQTQEAMLVDWTISILGSVFSILGLGVRVVFQALSYLLDTHPGRMQFCLCLCLIAAYFLFLLVQGVQEKTTTCWVVAVLMHTALLSSIFWMNAIMYDLWGRFRFGRLLSSLREKRCMMKIALYCCLFPILIVSIAIVLDFVLPDSEFAPAYNVGCWLVNPKALLTFFVGPVTFLSSLNLVLIVMTWRNLHIHYKSSRVVRSLSSSSPVLSVPVCTKMAALTGSTWLIGLVAGLVDSDILWVVFSAVNSSYGLIISVALLWNRRLWRSLAFPGKKKAVVPIINVIHGRNSSSVASCESKLPQD